MKRNNKKREKRIEFVDIFRGFAVFVMIAIQIFDAISVSNIYTTPPYYIKAINSVTFLPPSILFTFVSGMSVLLLVEKRRKRNESIGKEIFKKYFRYIVLSFFFTIIMWNILVWIGWEEAVQGIALTAIIFGFILTFIKNFNYIVGLLLILLSIFFHYLIRTLINYSSLSVIFPWPTTISHNYLILLGGLFLNAIARGWFSIFNLLPMMIGGALLLKLLLKNKRLIAFLTSTSFLFISFILHSLGLKIDYYNRSLSFGFFSVGLAMFFFFIIYMIYEKNKRWKGWHFFDVMGLAAFFIYVFHYLFIIKLLKITGLSDLLSDWLSWFLVIPCIALIYFISKYYILLRKRIPSYLKI